MGVLSGLKPVKVFEYFELLNSVPRGSGNTKMVSDICVKFAKEHGFEYYQDGLNNVIIIKEASKGYEEAEPVIIQGHLDMVCAKEKDNPIDMAKEPIKLRVDGDWLKAEGTTLGGDDGIAVAMAMAAMDDESLEHPRIEAVFTVDEETGMYGAAGIDLSPLKGKKMINIDSEEEGIITAGCAGGARVNFEIPVERCKAEDRVFYDVEITGLLGGHSGAEIHLGRGNSNKLMAEFLNSVRKEIGLLLVDFEGGKFDNVICSHTDAKVCLKKEDAEKFENRAKLFDSEYKKRFAKSDAGVKLFAKSAKAGEPLTKESTERVLSVIDEMPQAVQSMSKDIEGLVQTSLNNGILKLNAASFNFSLSVRSSSGVEKKALVEKINAIGKKYGAEVGVRGDYPAWEFRQNSPFRNLVAEVCKEVLGKEAEITVIHAGLECGLLGNKIEGLDSVSIGPEMHEVHSPRERLSIASSARTYEILCEILRRSR